MFWSSTIIKPTALILRYQIALSSGDLNAIKAEVSVSEHAIPKRKPSLSLRCVDCLGRSFAGKVQMR